MVRRVTHFIFSLLVLCLGVYQTAEAANCQSRVFVQGRVQTFNNCLPSNRFVSSRSFGGRFEFFNDAVPVQNFNKLLKRGNTLIAQDNSGAHIRIFVDRAGNLIDRFGNRVADFEPEVVRQLRRFYLLNRQKFNGNARNIVDRFLNANGGVGDGRLVVDLASFTLEGADGKDPNADIKNLVDANGKPVDRLSAGLAAFNMLLNTIQTRCLIRILPEQIDRKTGVLSVDLARFRDRNGVSCFNGEQLAFMQDADKSSQCNGRKVRLNTLMHTMLDPKNYYRGLGVDNLARQGLTDRQAVAAIFGINEDIRATPRRNMLIGIDDKGVGESGVATGDHRVVQWQESRTLPGRTCWRSFDFTDINPNGAETDSRNVYKNGPLFAHDAEEWLCLGANGFIMTFLFDGAGKLIDRAPAQIATGGGGLAPAIQSPASCYNCHKDGFLGGGLRQSNGKPYTEQKFRIDNKPTIFSDELSRSLGKTLTYQDYFVTNGEYRGVANQYSELFKSAQAAAGGRIFRRTDKGIETAALIPESIVADKTAILPEVAARELATSVDTAKAILGSQPMTRADFDDKFCNLKRGVDSRVNEVQERTLIRRESTDSILDQNRSHQIGQFGTAGGFVNGQFNFGSGRRRSR